MKRRTVVAAIVIGIPVIVLTCALLYLRFADLSGWRDTVAERLSESLGRKITISGEFEPEIGLTTRLKAGGIRLANTPWSDDPTMVSIRHLSIDLKLLSLVSGPLTIHDIEIEGAHVLLEKNADGQTNWVFDTGESSKPSTGPLELVLRHVLLEDAQLTWQEPSRAAPLVAGITRFESTEDDAGRLDLAFDGAVDGRRIGFSGRLGTLDGLLNAAAISYDLTGTLGGVRLSSTGNINELKTLGGADLTADVEGDDLAILQQFIAFPSELTGPFRLSVQLSPSGRGSKIEVDGAAAGITAEIAGTIDELLDPQALEATVTASGPSIRTLGSLTGITDLPDEPFSVSGGVRWEGFPITFRKVEVEVGGNSLSADGVLGAPPEMMGTDFSLHGEGPDIASIAVLAGIALPHDSYSVNCRLIRVDEGLEVASLEARVGRTEISASGTIGDPPEYAGTTLQVHAAGPNLAHFNRLIGKDLPAVDFAIDGRLTQGEEAVTLDGVSARIGTATIRADGLLHTGARLSGTRLKIDARGSDATQITILAGFTLLPDEPWSASGTLTFLDAGYRLDGVSANIGNLHAQGSGLIAAAHRSIGTHLELEIEDPDLSHAMSIFKVPGFPQYPVRAAGTLRIDDAGYGLETVTATAGDIDLAVDGLVGRGSRLDGTRGHIRVHGPRLSSIDSFVHWDWLPEVPFSVEGEFQAAGGQIDLENIVSEFDGNQVTINGSLAPVTGLIGTDVTVEIKGPDLARAGRLAAGLTTMPELPTGSFTMATRLNINDDGYDVTGLRATLDRATATVDGRVCTAAGMVGTDLSVTADGPDASVFSALSGFDLPADRFEVSGRLQRTDVVLLFDRVAADVGGHTVKNHGSLGERPRLVGTELDFVASGPGTALVAELTGFHKLPDQPFRLAGHFEGTPETFTADRLGLVLGPSDLRGTLEVDLRGKPDVTAQLRSDHLDLAWLSGPRKTSTDTPPADTPSDAAAARPTKKTARVISDTPIDFGWLRRADGQLDLTIAALQMPVELFHDVEMQVRLEDGRLDVHRLAMAGSRGGSGSGSLVLEPVGHGYLGDLLLDMDGIHFTVQGEQARDIAEQPPFDLDVRLRAEGASPREMAASANGSIQVVFGKGIMDNRVLDLISRDILLTLLKAFNPFTKDEKATELQCAIALFTIDDGLATLDPMAMQSDKMTMLGKGRIDFTTEKLDLNWVTKPRKGIGISASMITNPYIKLGGTLANPAIELKGGQAVASTGAAVATLGLSMVAKGMLDRVTAEKKVCEKALEEIGRGAEARASKPRD